MIAKSGSGKSELLKMLVLLLKTPLFPWETKRCAFRTVIVLDPHGDLVRECAQQKAWLKTFRQSTRNGKRPRVAVISPNHKRGWTPSLNPFDLKGKRLSFRQLQVLAQHLTSVFASILGRGSVTLSAHMRTVLVPLFTVLLVMAQTRRHQITFHHLERFLDDQRNGDLVAFARKEIRHEALQSFFRHLYFEPRLRSTKFALQTRLASLLNLASFTDLFCHPTSTWDLSRLMESGSLLLIDADASRLGSLVSEIFGRTVTALVQGYAFARTPFQRQRPVYFFIDEAATFTSPDIATMLTQTRKFGVHLLLANQLVGQGGGDKTFTDTIMGNTGIKIVGNVGEASRSAMAKECECSTDQLRGFKVGEFAVKLDNGLPLRKIVLPEYWVGTKSAMSEKQWCSVVDDQLKHFSRPLNASGESSKTYWKDPPENSAQNMENYVFHPRPLHF